MTLPLTIREIPSSQLQTFCESITAKTEESLRWFDTARKVNSLFKTEFSIHLIRYIDGKETAKLIDGYPVNVINWLKIESDGYTTTICGGQEYERYLLENNLRSLYENAVDGFPIESTATIPLKQITSAEKLTKELFAKLESSSLQQITSLTITVTLFDREGAEIDSKEWSL